MMRLNLFRVLFFVFTFSVSFPLYAATITTKVDRNPVGIDESFQIIFETSENPDADPDFSPLTKHFDILNSSQSSNTSIINGNIKHSIQWILTVMAKRQGKINIPSISFGKDRSQAVTIEVGRSRQGKSSQATEEIFVEVEIDKNDPYVQAQVIYTAKLFRSVATSNASLSDPQLDPGVAVIEKLGEDKNYEVQRGSNRYLVTERQYAVFPQKSGSINIDPIVFQGQIGAAGRLFVDPFGPPPRTVVKRSNAIELHVKSIPTTFTGTNWLPAAKVQLSEQWSSDPLKFKQGEPVTRTLKLQVQGLPASQLPEISSKLDEQLKQYPDQPLFDEKYDRNGLIGSRQQKTALIPSSPGEYMLPAIKLPWWNTVTDKLEYAELPARKINVIQTAMANAVTPSMTRGEADNTVTDEKSSPPQEMVAKEQVNYWKWASLILLAAWLVTLLAWQKGKKYHLEKQKSEQIKTLNVSIKAVREACRKNDPELAKTNLIHWAKHVWPNDPASSLGEISQRCSTEFAKEINELNRLLYGKEQGSWQGEDLLNAFDTFQKNHKTETNDIVSNLEPLHQL